MQVLDQQTQAAMFEGNRLRPHFVRSISRSKRPVGRVYRERDPDSKLDHYLAEIEEAYVVRIYDPLEKKELEVVIDPRHPQARDQMKLAQDVIEGRVGGLTPLRMDVEYAEALDPEGNAIEGTAILRVAEMENPVLTRAQAKVVVGGHAIGEWSSELDAEVDRSCSFEIAKRFSAYMEEISKDPTEAKWLEVYRKGVDMMAANLKSAGLDDAEITKEIERHQIKREDFLAGMHVDQTNGTRIVQTVWDPMRSPVPGAPAEQADFFVQKALIAEFQNEMKCVQMKDSTGNTTFSDIVTFTEAKLMSEEALPGGKPQRQSQITHLICDEKSRQIGTHLLAGYMRVQGARVADRALAAELDAKWRLHADVLETLRDAEVTDPESVKAHYFLAAQERAKFYSAESRLKVERLARASMKFPVEKEPEDKEHFQPKAVVGVLQHMGDKMGEAGHSVESISFGL